MMHPIASFSLLVALTGILGLSVPIYASAISTSTETGQLPNEVIAAHTLKDEVSSQLQSIIAMAPLELDASQDPFYSENVTRQAESYLSERLSLGMLTGSGEIRLSNSTSPLAFTSTGTEITDSATTAVVSNETITLQSGSESAQVSMFQIAHYRSDDGIQRKAVIAIFDTNSTEQLAALDGMIGIGESELTAAGHVHTTLWALS
jgi:hypothetical protein